MRSSGRIVVAILLFATAADARPARAGFAVGAGWLTHHEDTAGSRGTMSTAFYGIELAHGLDGVLETVMLSGASYSPESSLSQEVVGLQVGARWAPLRIADTTGGVWEPRDIYVQLVVGVHVLTLTPYTSPFAESQNTSGGPVVGAAIGWFPARFGNARFGFELMDNIGFYTKGDAGTRQHIAFTTGVEVQL